MATDKELKQAILERDTARRVAQEALRHLTDKQLAQVRDVLDLEDINEFRGSDPDRC